MIVPAGPQLFVAFPFNQRPSSSAPPEWAGPEEPGARSPSAWLERRNVGMRGTTNNGKAILCTGGFQPTDQISGWDPEREQTAPNGKCKLLDVR